MEDEWGEIKKDYNIFVLNWELYEFLEKPLFI